VEKMAEARLSLRRTIVRRQGEKKRDGGDRRKGEKKRREGEKRKRGIRGRE
jgi:hypothetical protein